MQEFGLKTLMPVNRGMPSLPLVEVKMMVFYKCVSSRKRGMSKCRVISRLTSLDKRTRYARFQSDLLLIFLKRKEPSRQRPR